MRAELRAPFGEFGDAAAGHQHHAQGNPPDKELQGKLRSRTHDPVDGDTEQVPRDKHGNGIAPVGQQDDEHRADHHVGHGRRGCFVLQKREGQKECEAVKDGEIRVAKVVRLELCRPPPVQGKEKAQTRRYKAKAEVVV